MMGIVNVDVGNTAVPAWVIEIVMLFDAIGIDGISIKWEGKHLLSRSLDPEKYLLSFTAWQGQKYAEPIAGSSFIP